MLKDYFILKKYDENLRLEVYLVPSIMESFIIFVVANPKS